MKTIELPTMTDDEIDMLKGLRGQMSDGAGENSDWCNKYWQNIVGFENKDGKSYFSFNESGAFANKTDDKVIKTLGRAFNKICVMLNEIPDCGPELFYKDERRNHTQHKVARSVVQKLTGKDNYHVPTIGELRMAAQRFYGVFGSFGF
jgi:hypothetical protein